VGAKARQRQRHGGWRSGGMTDGDVEALDGGGDAQPTARWSRVVEPSGGQLRRAWT
jgi:hypothetical protein